MKLIVTNVEKSAIKSGPNKDKPFFVIEGFYGPKHRMMDGRLIDFGPNNEAARKVWEEYWDGQVAASVRDAIDVHVSIVGDASTGDQPLPLFQFKDRTTGGWRPEPHSTMRVLVAADEFGKPLDSPRAKALRIINTPELCKVIVPTTADGGDVPV